jgi:AMP-polyphosphate phosphotransferase
VKAAAAARDGALREALLEAQYALAAGAGAGVLVLASGIPVAGRTETIAKLVEWLDPKRYGTFAAPIGAAPETRPPYFAWWHAVPARGQVAIVYGGWYEDLLRVERKSAPSAARLRHAVESIRSFESFLNAEGVTVVKLHFSIAKEEQRRRLKHLARHPQTAWRVSREDWRFSRRYDAETARIAELLRRTDRPGARWHRIDGSHRGPRLAAAARALLGALRRAGRRAAREAVPAPRPEPAPRRRHSFPSAPPRLRRDSVLALGEEQGRLARLRHRRGAPRLAIVCEGMDAAGKSTVIRRITAALDPRECRVVAACRPTPEELAHPYLWRFWRALPKSGETVIFDRSWYGRLLVERVEGLASRARLARAPAEIHRFESELVDSGVVLVKLWLSVGREEQLRRFQARAAVPFKRYKLEPADYRGRRLWWQYQRAAGEALLATSSAEAPWTVVPADDKPYARYAVLRAVCARLERR